MYVTLLLLTPALCEWVEISQHHYSRKPVRTHHFRPTTEAYSEKSVVGTIQNPFNQPHRVHDSHFKDIVTEAYEEETTSYRKPVRTQYFPADGVTEVYVEDSLSDSLQYRHKNPIGNHFPTTDRVTEDYTEETTSYYRRPIGPNFSADSVDEDRAEFNKRNRIYLNQSISGFNMWNKGNIDKVPKHGNVQRVHLDSNSVKAPNLKTKPARNSSYQEFLQIKNINNKDDVRDLSFVVMNTEATLQDSVGRIKSNKNRLSSEIFEETIKPSGHRGQFIADIGNDFKRTANRHNNVTLGMYFNDPSFVFITEGEDFDNDETSNIHHFKRPSSSYPAKIITATEKDQIPNLNEEQTIKGVDTKSKVITTMPNEFVTKTKKPLDDDYATVSDDNDGPTDKVSSSHKTKTKSPNDENLDKGGEESSKEPSDNAKANTMENLMMLMKVVAETIRRNTRRGVSSKTKYLRNLKDTILSSIKDRIDATWPDDEPAAQARPRVSRAAQATARGHLEIPSAESALMTISFLTFAVFLIKLVLQIIQAYKNKTMMVTPAVVATVGRSVAAKLNSKP